MNVAKMFLLATTVLVSGMVPTADIVEVPMLYVPPLKTDIVMTNGFTPHRGFQGTGYRMEPLHRAHSPMDYKAWHDESWDDLRVLYGPAWDWPREMTEAQNASDLETKHYANFLTQEWISFTVMNPEGTKVLGSLYITPSACGAYDSQIQYWITTPERAALEATFHAETKKWLSTVWPSKNPYYPGPEYTDAERGELYRKMNYGICN